MPGVRKAAMKRCTFPLCVHRTPNSGPCPNGHRGDCDDMPSIIAVDMIPPVVFERGLAIAIAAVAVWFELGEGSHFWALLWGLAAVGRWLDASRRPTT